MSCDLSIKVAFEIGIYTTDFQNKYISLTDIAKYKSKEANNVIKNWLRSRDTIEFLVCGRV